MEMVKKAKKNALFSLRGKWGIAIAITFLLQAVVTVFTLLEQLLLTVLGVKANFTSFEFAPDNWVNVVMLELVTIFVQIFIFLIGKPISLGAKKWYYKNAGAKTAGFYSVFSYMQTFELYAKTIWLEFNLSVRKAVYAVLFTLPGLVIFSIGFTNAVYGDWFGPTQLMLIFIGLTLVIFGLIGYYIVTLKYFLAPYYFIENPDLKVNHIIKVTSQFIKPRRMELVKLALGFLGWNILNILVFPILFVNPYYSSARAIYARVYIERLNEINKEVE